MPWSIAAAAVSSDTPSGTFTSASAAATTRSAYEPGADAHATRSPGATDVTPGPTASTTPAPSSPSDERERPRVEAGAEVDVDEVHAGGAHRDAGLTGLRRGDLLLLEAEHLGTPVCRDDDGARHAG